MEVRPVLTIGLTAETSALLVADDTSWSLQTTDLDAAIVDAQRTRCWLVVLDPVTAPGCGPVVAELMRLGVPVLAVAERVADAAALAGHAYCVAPGPDLPEAVERVVARQQAHEARTQGLRDLQRVVGALRDQIRGMEQARREEAHEIRTPVGIIRLFAYNLKDGIDGPLTESQAQSIDAIMRAAEQLAELLSAPANKRMDLPSWAEDLLEGRPERRRSTREQGDFGQLVRGISAMFDAEARQAGHRLEVAIADDLPRPWFDRAKMTQVVSNLLSNALKFTPAGGAVRVEVREERAGRAALRRLAGELRLTVTDDGPGIPKAEHEQIFERNQRGTSAALTGKPGSGIGLSVVKELVESHGGRAWVESEPGHGSRFHVVIPVDWRTRRLATHVLRLRDPALTPALLEALTELRGAPLQSVEASDLEAALQALLGGSIGLVVSDPSIP